MEYELWADSHHALAERPMRPRLDQAAFEPERTFKHGSQTTTTRLRDGQYEIVTAGFKTNVEPYRVERVIGHDPLRQFLTASSGGRWQTHEASYDPKSNQWFNVYGSEDRKPGEWGHWTGRGMNWNSMCADCHNTRLRKNYDETTDSYHTTMAEMSVGCEACHGALRAHVDWRRGHPKTTLKDPTISRLDPTQIIDTCGSCHSRREVLTGDFKPGDSFFDEFSLETLDSAGRWYPDGQVHDEDYEFTSFLSSKMYQSGVRCLDCHNPHSMKNLVQGNDLCMRCHNGGYAKAPIINPAEHGHHKLTDKGGACIGCHMPVTVYMQRHPRHDHGFTIPDPLLTKQLGIPNACNRCHADQSADWALNYTEQWYGTKMDRHTRERAQWIAAAEHADSGAKDGLIGVLGNSEEPFYWRAVAAGLLGDWAGEPTVKAALMKQLKNEHPLVREKVIQALGQQIGTDSETAVASKPMLNDTARSVRVAAGWALRGTVDVKSRAGRESEYALGLNADQPVGQFRKAMLLLARHDGTNALTHLEKGLAWDPFSPPLYYETAMVMNQLGRTADALETLRHAETIAPNDPQLPYGEAVILAEAGRNTGARVAAQRALAVQKGFKPATELLEELSRRPDVSRDINRIQR